MKKLITCLLIIFSLHLPTAAKAEDPIRLAAIGDSIPYGYNLEESNDHPSFRGFPYLVGMEKGWTVDNLSIPGLTSQELLVAVHDNELFRSTLKEADYVLLYIGGNDLLNVVKKNGGLKGLEMTDAAPAMQNLIQHVYSIVMEIDSLTDAEIFVYNLYNPYPAAGKKLDAPLVYINSQYAALIQLLDHFTNVSLLDAYKAFRGHSQLILPKDVHPSEKGQQILAELALKKLRDV
ncbi:SGNH/GDSL hydrolase family protein [Halobacillus fulvus]|nr:SGNH/GDSL hydrolase family protein [Halobacillus fulvus]